MHTLLMLSNLLLLTLSSRLALNLLHQQNKEDWATQRNGQLVVLLLPMSSLVLGIAALCHFSNQACFLNAPVWDYYFGTLLPVGMAVVAFAGLSVGIVRLTIMKGVLAYRSVQVEPRLQHLADRQAAQLGTRSPRLLICPHQGPLALAYGLRQPKILLSTWMLAHLDPRELEAVVAHEIGHIARRDYLMIWLASILKDAFFYLPTSWTAYRQLHQEKEFACDDLAVGVTRQPLALASALAKVWQYAVAEPPMEIAQPLTGAGQLMQARIERLLTLSQPILSRQPPAATPFGINFLTVAAILMLEALHVTVLLVPMGCGPLIWLLRSF